MELQEVIDISRDLLNEPLDSSRTFPDNSSSFYRDSSLIRYFNVVQDDIMNEIISVDENYFETSTYFNIVSGCSSYALPSGTIKIKRIEDARDTGSEPIEVRPVTINRKGDPSPLTFRSSTFMGGGYYMVGNTIHLTETPTYTNASAIRLIYVRDIADVTAASGISDLPVEHHQVLIWGVVKYSLMQGQADTTLADREYRDRVRAIKAMVNQRQIQRSRTVKDLTGDSDVY